MWFQHLLADGASFYDHVYVVRVRGVLFGDMLRHYIRMIVDRVARALFFSISFLGGQICLAPQGGGGG